MMTAKTTANSAIQIACKGALEMAPASTATTFELGLHELEGLWRDDGVV